MSMRMSTSMSMSVAEAAAIVQEMTRYAGDPATRRSVFAARHPAFVERHPKLFDMCCTLGPDDPMLTFFLERAAALASVASEDTAAAEAATQLVHERLNKVYIEPVVAAADKAAADKGAAASQ